MRIEDRLNKAATAVDHHVGAVPMRPAEAVGRRHQRQAIAMIASGGALALVLIVGSAFIFANGSEPTVPTTPADPAPAAALSTELESSDLDWEAVESTVRYLDNTFAWDGSVYALSTIPGRNPGEPPAARAIYSSSDGVMWDEDRIADDLWISDVDSYEGKIYSIATAPGLADATDGLQVRITSSEDFGRTWDVIDLPVIEAPSSELGSVLWLNAGTKLAAGPAGVVATAKGSFGMDYGPLIPAEFVTADHYVRATDVGIEVRNQRVAAEAQTACFEESEASLSEARAETVSGEAATTTTVAPINCELPGVGVVHTATWVDLGYTEPPETSFSRLYVSADGTSFDSVASPFRDEHLDQLIATQDGFLAVEAAFEPDRAKWRLWASPDGRQWEQTTLPGGVDYVQSVGSFGEKIVLLGRLGQDTFGVFSSDDSGRSWDAVPLPAPASAKDGFIGPFPVEADISDQGLVIALVSEPTEALLDSVPISQVIMTDDLLTWSEVPLAAHDATEGYVTGILNTEDLVLIAMSTFDGPDKHTTLVGSRK